jgi:hypothetical protein
MAKSNRKDKASSSLAGIGSKIVFPVCLLAIISSNTIICQPLAAQELRPKIDTPEGAPDPEVPLLPEEIIEQTEQRQNELKHGGDFRRAAPRAAGTSLPVQNTDDSHRKNHGLVPDTVRAVEAVGSGAVKGVESVGSGAGAVGRGALHGAGAVGHGAVSGVEAVGAGAEKVGRGALHGAGAVGHGAVSGVEAVGTGAEKVGRGALHGAGAVGHGAVSGVEAVGTGAEKVGRSALHGVESIGHGTVKGLSKIGKTVGIGKGEQENPAANIYHSLL